MTHQFGIRCIAPAFFALAAAACGSAPLEQSAASGEAVQTSNSSYFALNAPGFTHNDSLAQRAAGTVLVPTRNPDGSLVTTPDGTEVRTTCGVTFISGRYAVTAAHCVPSRDVRGTNIDLVTVQMYRLNANPDLTSAAYLS